MLFQEYAITPQLFDNQYLEENVSAQIYLKLFLSKLRKSGMLANMNDNQWLKEVNEYRKTLPPKLRDELSKIFEELAKHNRIVNHTTLTETNLEQEIDWLKLAIKEDDLKPYFAMLFTGKFEEPHEKSMSLEKYMEDYFSCDNDLSPTEQTLENIEKYLTDFLAYAKRLIIIDPYFTYNKDDDKVTLLLANLFAKRRGNRIHGRKIIIHTFYNQKDRFVDPDSTEYKQKWSKLFVEIYEKYNHTITLNIWADRNMHDRYMITDQGGISNSNGFGIIAFRKPHWSLLNNSEIREQLNYFILNANPSLKDKLIYSITKDDYDESIFYDNVATVIKIVHDNERGKVGFVKQGNKDYYFQMPSHITFIDKVVVGAEVEFDIKENFKGETAFITKVC